VIGLVALNEVLGIVLRGVVDVALVVVIGDHLLENDAANASCLGVPFHVIAAFEGPCHASPGLHHGTAIASGKEPLLVSCALRTSGSKKKELGKSKMDIQNPAPLLRKGCGTLEVMPRRN